jgi:hypothetical protein
MQPEPHEIAHVSDTALMTAACRAMETVDPAESLSGARGMAIANNLPGLGKSTSIQRSDAGSSSRQS